MPKVTYEKRARIAYVTLNRPGGDERHRPRETRAALETWQDFRDDDGVEPAMLLTGDAIEADRALQCNTVSHVVPRGELISTAEEVAARILRNDAWAVRPAKETILGVIGRPFDDQLPMRP